MSRGDVMAKTRIEKGDRTVGAFHQPPGVWLRMGTDGKDTARITCPGCGLSASLSDHHIDDEGLVTPSVDCPRCLYHEVGVILVGWGADQ